MAVALHTYLLDNKDRIFARITTYAPTEDDAVAIVDDINKPPAVTAPSPTVPVTVALRSEAVELATVTVPLIVDVTEPI